MINIVEQILGVTFGATSYDDIITSGALLLGITSILLIIYIFKRIIN